MENCIFCKIVAGEIPCQKVWEDENFLAFLDIHPVAEGHTLLIPKKHFRWVWDVANYPEYMEKAREIALLLKEKYQGSLVEMKVIGMDVPHAHIQLIPHEMKELLV